MNDEEVGATLYVNDTPLYGDYVVTPAIRIEAGKYLQRLSELPWELSKAVKENLNVTSPLMYLIYHGYITGLTLQAFEVKKESMKMLEESIEFYANKLGLEL